MLAELKLTLECADIPKISYNKASLLQGVIMQNINREYAETLHEQGLKPYSQCVRNEMGRNVWYIRTLSEEAYDKIITPLLDDGFCEFHLEHDDKTVNITEKQLVKYPKTELINTFYSEDSPRIFTIDFLTPTAFKKDGKYYFFPDIYNIYSSLMKKYDSSSSDDTMMNEDTLEQLTQCTHIVSYDLHSVKFSMEGIRIPAYMGNIVIKINGPQTMVNFAKLLFTFGNFSGIGIKTAVGMGMIRAAEKERKVSK